MSDDQVGETTKQRIFRIAAELFAARGFAATGVAELAEATGVGKGALYYHIGSKEELLYEIVKLHVEEALVYGEALVKAELPAEAKLRRLGRQQMRVIADHLPEVTLYFREEAALTGERRVSLSLIRKRWEDVWSRILEQGVEEGVFRSADSITVKGILGAFNYSWVWLRPDGALSPEEIADRLVETVLHGQLVVRNLPVSASSAVG
ncbi:TetR/AcrR family transcriptional regulator [Rhodococcus sp. NPDC127530]|uniref:TetR/AcrR family transcriptional regulator n=1 Tax=unclassified Rhodococcus (in: high G+C Gram-positive bacteria) TaxID=192944 RepID=UPI003629BEE7